MKAAVVPTVFIVDDDVGMRQAVQDLVESVGLRAESFTTGDEFLASSEKSVGHRYAPMAAGSSACATREPNAG